MNFKQGRKFLISSEWSSTPRLSISLYYKIITSKNFKFEYIPLDSRICKYAFPGDIFITRYLLNEWIVRYQEFVVPRSFSFVGPISLRLIFPLYNYPRFLRTPFSFPILITRVVSWRRHICIGCGSEIRHCTQYDVKSPFHLPAPTPHRPFWKRCWEFRIYHNFSKGLNGFAEVSVMEKLAR